MSNIVVLNPPSLDFTIGASGNYATKAWLSLEHAALRFDGGIPTDAEIVRSWLWSQQMADYPSSCYGDVTWAVTPPLYTALSGVPAQERCQPIGLGLLGRLLIRPGADLLDWRDHDPAMAYPPDSLIGIFPEINGAPYRFVSLFAALRVRSATSFTELPGIIYHDLPNQATSASGANSYRNTFSGIHMGGSEVRVTTVALGPGCTLLRQSIGVRDGSSGFTMKAAPVQLSYGGSPGLSLGPMEIRRSDWAPLDTAAGDALLVHSCVDGAWAFKDVSVADGNPGCTAAGTVGYDTQGFNGTVQVINGRHRKHVVAMIEVR